MEAKLAKIAQIHKSVADKPLLVVVWLKRVTMAAHNTYGDSIDGKWRLVRWLVVTGLP